VPRDRTVDGLVARCGSAVVVAGPGSPVAALAIEELAALGVRARAIGPVPRGAARIAALAGLRAPRLHDEEAGR
jgi:hypothetical protein